MNQKQIKKRVSSIKNIGKITSALEMVAASRVQRAQDLALAARPYADKIYELVSAMSQEKVHTVPLMRQPADFNRDLYVVISTNKGLAGSLNTNLLSSLAKHLAKTNIPHQFVTLGRKARPFALKNGKLVSDFSDIEPFEKNIPAIASTIVELFTQEKIDRVCLVYSSFVNIMTQEPVVKELLPISRSEESQEKTVPYTFEPSTEEVLESLLVFYIENQLREAITSASASEHASRMLAMKNASDNAKELGSVLGLEYNKARQTAITTEIADVVTSTESLSI
ncbi:ATP synthase F1 subunit gamma [Candidatus Woesebacteria bacterium RIFCSPHIGHO2_01_FULL_44_21]|uniref:ATP synthase gamma chain n=1 Tax=Candidatus Woesebacteria bacterium RIFCSPHIGHO2_01_FULL_44_21 TaxID=1802503 RepID=A0A1F7Z143_9BACT|nr:MAG: ATP synthase F1 subunit gamma [Candidatus Woesebacteria bacterium RIFCSPHIGHO2_01_FULL_44_21]OGM71106.1 MAG: ATP synthase F1 subunit gamma [Candidatus Woesebacteria bacterium RIFCSPLOWO2_01_FULL_44_24b]